MEEEEEEEDEDEPGARPAPPLLSCVCGGAADDSAAQSVVEIFSSGLGGTDVSSSLTGLLFSGDLRRDRGWTFLNGSWGQKMVCLRLCASVLFVKKKQKNN